MKNKVLFASCVLAAALAGCQNEEFESVSVGEQATSGLVEVGDNFMIASVGATVPGTRTNWVEETVNGKKVLTNIFSPVIPNGSAGETANTAIASTNVLAPTIGACNLIGGSIHSNYEFFHYGWLSKDQTKAVPEDCPELIGYPFANAWVYSELSYSSTTPSNPGDDAAWDASGKSWLLTDATNATKTLADGTQLKVSEMNPNSGIYKTENKAMFEGDYILYYPYNPDFSSGALYAESEVLFENVDGELANRNVSDNTFRYAYAPGMVGGTTAASFEFKNLSGILQVNLKLAQGEVFADQVEKIMLYSPSGAFLKKVSLDPSAIAAGQTGTNIYGNEKEYSKTILLDLKTANTLSATTPLTVYVAVLPTTIPDLEVYAYANGKWASYEVGSKPIAAGTGTGVNATYAADDFKAKYLAVDAETLVEALDDAAGADEQNPATIEVLGDITLDAANNTTGSATGRYDITPYVTITGDKIIVPEGAWLVLQENATIESAVDVEGQSCCGSAAAGKMNVRKGGVIAGTVNILAGYEGKESAVLTFNNQGTDVAEIAATATVNVEGSVAFETATDIRGALNIAEDATATVNGTAADVNVYGGKIVNNGTFTVEDGAFAMLAASGETDYTAGQNFTNNGTFIDNLSTAQIGAAVQSMNQNGTYICQVTNQAQMNTAYQTKDACSMIQIIAAITTSGSSSVDYYDLAAAEQHNGKDVDIDVVVSGVNIQPSKQVTIGNLSVSEVGALTIKTTTTTKNQAGAITAYHSIAVNGDIKVNAGSLTTATDVVNMTAKNMTVAKDAKATFGERKEFAGMTNLAVNDLIDVNGTMELKGSQAAGTNAYVTCSRLDAGGTFVNGAKPETLKK